MKLRLYKLTASVICAGLLVACSPQGTENTDSKTEIRDTQGENVSEMIAELVTYKEDDEYTDWREEEATTISLNGTSATVEGEGGAVVQGNQVMIRTSGIYVLNGTLEDGQIVVDAEDQGNVRLVLNGVEIHSANQSPIYVKNAEKTVISLENGTKNILSDGDDYELEDPTTDEPNATIFSKDDLTINGTGELKIQGNYNNGIVSKDDLKIMEGTIQIESVDDGLMGRDLLAIREGNFTIKAGGDALKSTNDKDEAKGNITIEGGTFQLEAGSDGIQSIKSLWIADGEFSIDAGGGSPETIEKGAGDRFIPREKDEQDTTTDTETDTDAVSGKGIKAAGELGIADGTFDINSADDGIHSNQNVTISNGEITIATGDDGIHADSSVAIKGGTVTILKSYEGIEGNAISIEDGTIHVQASDDGVNIGGGNDGSGMDMNSESTDGLLLSIKGGYMYIDAAGDGLDSNGSIEMTGGTVIVNGPTDNGNGALDYDQSFTISGGLLIAAGSSGMAMTPSNDSSQFSMMMSFPETQSAETIVRIQDGEGKDVITFAPAKEYQTVLISSPDLKQDETYQLYSGGTATEKDVDGLFSEDAVKDSNKVLEFTLTESVTWLDESGVTEAKTQGFGGLGGQGEQGGPGGQGGQGKPAGERPDGNDMGENPTEGNPPGDMFGDLDDATKEKVQDIMKQQQEGTLTREEADEKLLELGIELPRKDSRQE